MTPTSLKKHSYALLAERGPDTSDQLKIVSKEGDPVGHIGFCGSTIILKMGRYHLNGNHFNINAEKAFSGLSAIKEFIAGRLISTADMN